MKIQVSRIPEEGCQVEYTLDGDWYREYLQKGGGIDFRIHPVRVASTIHKILETVTLEMGVGTALELDCGRCLESFTLPVRTDFLHTLVSAHGEEDQEADPADEDISFGYYQDDWIDLDALVYEQIMLQVPMKPLCVEACRGLCARCGANLNVAPCPCSPGAIDSGLEALKSFTTKKQP